MRSKTSFTLVSGLLLCALCTAGCGGGDDDTDGGSGSGGTGSAGSGSQGREPCATPGFTQTGCTCGNGAVGTRVCGDDSFWKACDCPPSYESCTEGMMVTCYLCPGETTPHTTICLQGGTLNCCGDQAASAGGAAGSE